MKHLSTSKVYTELETIKNLVKTNNVQFIDINEAAEFLKLKKSYLYFLVHKKRIPYYKPKRRIYFNRIELQTWILDAKVKTIYEIEKEHEENKSFKKLFLTSN